jgi:hypothetical protein
VPLESSQHPESSDSPFLRPTSPRLPDILTDGAIHLMGTVGVDQFSIRGLARWMGVTPSRLLDTASRTRLVEIIAITFGDRWLDWTVATHGSESPLRLPTTPDELLAVRTRAALEQLAEAERLRGRPEPSHQLDYLDTQERLQLERRLRTLAPSCCAPDDDEVRATMAVLAGLRSALAAQPARMTPMLAERVAAELTRAVTSHRRDCADHEQQTLAS